MEYTVSIAGVIKQYNLRLLTKNADVGNISLSHPEVNRPALQLAGFYEYFDADRLQIIGRVEYAYLMSVSPEERAVKLRRLFEAKIPCVVVCRDLEPFPEMLEYAEMNGVPVLHSEEMTSDFMADVSRWLKAELAPRTTIHGVFVDIYGEGVLITGESGIGKSEAALELIKRGHRLVADDAVEVRKVSSQTLIGTCPEILRYFMEIRGIGIIDIKQMFGVQSIKATQNIDLMIKLEFWDDKKEYDRMGLEDEFTELFGMNVMCHTIPMRPGRNLSVICESAAVSRRQKKMGYNASKALSDRVFGKSD